MIVLIIFAFIAGVVTILSPCILPILPIVLSSSATSGKKKPIGVVMGFVASFTFFTLFLSTIVKLFGISADVLRTISVMVVAGFGVSLLVPQFMALTERLFSKLSGLVGNNAQRDGLVGGLLIGLSLGLVWTPCVGPILASVISLSFTGSVSWSALIITLAYSLGTAIPMFAVIIGGREALSRVPWLLANAQNIQKGFGLLMILTALAIFNNWDRKFQTYVLDAFPQYGSGLTSFEDNDLVKSALKNLGGDDSWSKSGPYTLDEMQKRAPELILDGEWFNSKPLRLSELDGKVVLIDFWTYSCINCIRTLPYLRNWHEKYSDDGLVIIGVHTPEFGFEKDPENVLDAIEDFGIEYPVMQDNEFRTWRAYKNRYWPAKYLIDKNGFVVYTHFGEGAYDETESMIQKLLSETGVSVEERIDNPEYTLESRTPELYLGYWRIEAMANFESNQIDRIFEYKHPKSLSPNRYSIEGNWLVSEKFARGSVGSSLRLRFSAKDVIAVMESVDGFARVQVLLDGEVVEEGEIGEVLENGIIEIDKPKAYFLIDRDLGNEGLLELRIIEGSVDIYTFTFG